MATYKKRGYKPQTKEEVTEVIEENSTTAEVFNSLDEGASKTEEWVADNQKYILIGISVIVLVVLAYLAYNSFIQEPKEIKAANAMYQAQQYFDEAIAASTETKDSLYTLSLHGGEAQLGFQEIISNYGGTKSGNLARYYAGFAYLNTGAYQEAIDQLDDFKSDDELLGPLALGGIGDAFVQLGQLEEGLSYYEKAAKVKENGYTTPKFLIKAGLLALELGKSDLATQYLEQVSADYAKAAKDSKVAVYLAKAQAMQ